MKTLIKKILFVSLTLVYGMEDSKPRSLDAVSANCDNLGGECISIKDCPVFKTYIQSSIGQKVINKYICGYWIGFDRIVAKVCCQSEKCTFDELQSKTCRRNNENVGNSNKDPTPKPTDAVSANSYCYTPNGDKGTCKSLKDCPPLLKLVLKKRTAKETKMLLESQCDFSNKITQVCCANTNITPQILNDTQCYNADGNLGVCIGINECANLKIILPSSTSTEHLKFINNSRCEGPDMHSVCCGPDPVSNVNRPDVCEPSTAPPDPRTECCGIETYSSNKIHGGNATAIDQYPWLVLIEYRKKENNKILLLCGGSLISSKYVLTAAHCLVGAILNTVTPENVRLGEYDTSNAGEDCIKAAGGGQDCNEDPVIIPIQKSIPHRDYDSVLLRNDIALIRMTDNAPYNDFIRPICLPTSDVTQSNQNLVLYAAGWGAVSDNESSSNIKLHVDLPYVPLEECQKAYSHPTRNVKLWNKHICAGGKFGKDSCKGDSGGPLMYEDGKIYSVVGVVNFGPKPCGKKDVPGVYANVYEYIPWIRSNIKP